ncbi:hypothetical protein BB559_000867 [Furculomyces boomerangus]|uniref:Uncharacterized protein n=2 Tax=Harpellales TaxID=61421 RepID=A0A2T9Z3S6_9FUNG|nr:hypothetical protein BB559_000867 [Furculomyces boomerangus]PVZ98986.1 hypothetical protein BB558_005005 [Smittium angustum]
MSNMAKTKKKSAISDNYNKRTSQGRALQIPIKTAESHSSRSKPIVLTMPSTSTSPSSIHLSVSGTLEDQAIRNYVNEREHALKKKYYISNGIFGILFITVIVLCLSTLKKVDFKIKIIIISISASITFSALLTNYLIRRKKLKSLKKYEENTLKRRQSDLTTFSSGRRKMSSISDINYPDQQYLYKEKI